MKTRWVRDVYQWQYRIDGRTHGHIEVRGARFYGSFFDGMHWRKVTGSYKKLREAKEALLASMAAAALGAQ